MFEVAGRSDVVSVKFGCQVSPRDLTSVIDGRVGRTRWSSSLKNLPRQPAWVVLLTPMSLR